MGLSITPHEDIPPLKIPSCLEEIELRPNPERLANLERCIDIVQELAGEWEMKAKVSSVHGGMRFDFRFFSVPFFSDMNRLLGELITRSDQFCSKADPKDSNYACLNMIVFGQDLVWDGKVLWE